MNYTLHQLQIFVKIAELGSISKAAEALFLSQPGVSLQLQQLQQQFDMPLTEPSGRRILITDFGHEIAAAARRILLEADALNRQADAYKGILSGRMRIAVVSTGKYVMPYFLTDFLQKHPAIELHMDVTNRQRVLDSIRQREADFGLVSILPGVDTMESLPLMPHRIYLVGKAGSKASVFGKKGVAWEKVPLIFREKGSGTRLLMEAFLREKGIPYQLKLELISNEAVKQAVLAGLGFSILPLVGIRHELQTGELEIIPVEGLPLKTDWQLIWLSKRRLLPVPQAYLDYIGKQAAQLVNRHFPHQQFEPSGVN
ncbi:MAG: LysR substrate-binding domain-containing protein [Chitinophagaceae bacterium]|jgi:DNA-binding transcriptional LysR family regulator|nr:LysR substrate-binding domain-containing protein [Chitinophagaceae bacterium]